MQLSTTIRDIAAAEYIMSHMIITRCSSPVASRHACRPAQGMSLQACLDEPATDGEHVVMTTCLALLHATAYLVDIGAMQPSEGPLSRDRIPGPHLLCSLCCSLALCFIGRGSLLGPLHKVGRGLDAPHSLQGPMLCSPHVKDRYSTH